MTRIDPDLAAATAQPHFAAVVENDVAPGLAFGVIADGRLVHAGGCGTRAPGDDGTTPTADSLFRIASMTKSITAATVLSLRDDRLLSLDSAVHEYVPELLSGSADNRVITLRHLLTMGAGFLTDDPWGDRQQALSSSEFVALLSSGVSPVVRPGERFEYSNLGYAILGLALERVTSMPFADLVRMRVLDPLGMTATCFSPPAQADVVPGFVRRSSGWVEEPRADHGAFSPMGGLYSSVSDVARWVELLLSARSGAPDHGSAVLRPATLLEMQRTHRLVGAVTAGTPGGPPVVTGYGFGLFEEFGHLGRVVYHSGGYPGYGSHMRWHPSSGAGLVALANSTYAPMSTVAARALSEVVEDSAAPRHVDLPDLAGLDRARDAVVAWLEADHPDGEEGEILRRLCADNVEQDVPWAERLLQWEQLRAEIGVPTVLSASRSSPGAVVIEIAGTGRPVRVAVMVAPQDPMKIQSVAMRPVPPDPAPPVATDLS